MKMPVVYIAGPYRGPTREAMELNIQVARKLGALACLKGWFPIIPHANTSHLDAVVQSFFFKNQVDTCYQPLSDQFWLDGTLELLRRSDAVLLCPGWKSSRGTLAEIREARLLGLPVFYQDCDLPEAVSWRTGYANLDKPAAEKAPEPVSNADDLAPGGTF